MGDRLRAGMPIPSRYVASQLGQLIIDNDVAEGANIDRRQTFGAVTRLAMDTHIHGYFYAI